MKAPYSNKAPGFRGGARAFLGDEGGVEDMRRALDAAMAQGLGREAALLHYNLAETLWLNEGAWVRLGTLKTGLTFAQRRGIEEFVLALGAEIVAALVELGSYGEALERAVELDPRLEEAGAIFDQLILRSSQVAALARRGALDAALEPSKWTIARAREFENPQWLAYSLGRGAALHLAVGDLASARALLEELERIERSTPQYPAVLPDAVRTALALGNADLAQRLAEGVAPKPLLREGALLEARALIAGHAGRHVEAEGMFAEAAQRWERLQTPWERAHALLGQGRCLLALGRPGDAGDTVRTARDIFKSMEATPALAEADSLLERASALAS